MNRVDIDIVLTLYKRPDCLRKQINALKEQTFKPRNIYLYQDGIDSYYQIKLKEEILKEFSDVRVSESNGGVWKRFEYARETVRSPYVCIFDDDTIPGKRWLENCYLQMQKKEGIYGTNGILLSNSNEYPLNNKDERIGWVNPNQNTVMVDFVGHSWFLKTEWLDYMLTKSQKLQKKYKYVGEDMYLSYQCYLHNIGTYVPPHPYNIPELWGSIPSSAKLYGSMKVAISSKSINYKKMNEVLIELREYGWKIICERNPDYYLQTLTLLKQNRHNKEEQILSKLYTVCCGRKDIYLYGAGEYGRIFYEYLKRQQISIKAFVVSEIKKEERKCYYNIPIIGINELLEKREKGIVILALNEFFHNEIRQSLSLTSDFDIFPFEKDNVTYEELIEALKNYNISKNI